METELYNALIMRLIIYDTEFTAWEGSQHRGWGLPWEARELIQFSASCIQITEQGLSVETGLNHFIKPNKNPKLSDYIQDLTGISQTDVDNGLAPKDFFQQLASFTENGQIAMASWGNDLHVLQETATLNQLSPDWIQSYDLIKVFEPFGVNTNVSSGELFQQFNLALEVHEHNALDDTRSLVASLNALHQQAPKTTFQRIQALIDQNP